jgi:hypothetical protein
MFTFHFRLSAKDNRTGDDSKRFLTRGEVYIETENGDFPCAGWGDRIFSVLSMWVSNAMRMVDPNYGEQQVTNYSMDGPYSFDLQKMPEDRVLVRFVKRVGAKEQEEMPMLNISLTDYCHALLALAENFISDPYFQWYGEEQKRMKFQEGVNRFKALFSSENYPHC